MVRSAVSASQNPLMKNSGVPTFADVARLIAPKNSPPWLPELFRVYGLEITKDRKLQETLPSKADMRKRLLEAKQAAQRILDLLNDTMTMVFVEAESNNQFENIAQLESDLKGFGGAIELAAASPIIAKPGGKTKKGRGRAVGRTTISPKGFCALVVAESWLYVRGHHPTFGNRAAAAAAQAYWLACGATTGSWGSDPRTSWSYHFRDARSGATRVMRAEVQQRCAGLRADHNKYAGSEGK
jgi:hypothetical protein